MYFYLYQYKVFWEGSGKFLFSKKGFPEKSIKLNLLVAATAGGCCTFVLIGISVK